MTEVIGVRFKRVGKVYYFDPCGIQVKNEMPVIVETARGQEYGEVAMSNTRVEDSTIVQPLKKLIRLATPADTRTMEQNLQFEKDAFHVCEEKIRKHKLEMKLVSVEYTFDRSKILFYFSAEGRVDFRELVKDLAGVFRTRIELRQIGVRDEAKMIGGLGICGRPLCCSAFLDGFQPVSINMAKDQGLSLNPTKISGACGRLMCCLKYENEAYQELLKTTPPNDSLVDTPYGRGTVMDASLLRGTCRVRMLHDPDTPVTVPCQQCCILRRGRDKGEPLPDLPAPPKPQPLPESARRAAAPASEAPGSDRPEKPQGERRPKRRYDKPRRPDKPQGERPQPAQEGRPRPADKPRRERPQPSQERPAEKPQSGQNAQPAQSSQNGQNGQNGQHKRRYRGGSRGRRNGNGGKPQGEVPTKAD